MGVPPSDNEPTGAPRWVKTFAIVAAVILLLVVAVVLLTGHGPGRHLGGGHATDAAHALNAVIESAALEPAREPYP